MASFNGKPITKFGFTGSGTGATEKDIKAFVLSVEPVVTNVLQDVTSVDNTGMDREYVRQDARFSVVCQKTDGANDAWKQIRSDTGTYSLDIDYSGNSGPTGGDIACKAITESITAPYGPDGNQAFTVVMLLSGGAAITWA